MEGGWVLLSECEAAGHTPVRRLRSPSGLRLTSIQVEGPLVAAYIALATEANDNDGLPHTLEHLVFLGSEDYPYKGLLDLFANRCFASGTNAWTDTDHTAYTLKTAGEKGMLKMLPIYLDHILYPVLTEEAFITEVHHVTGEGKDAGVVYSEMQGRENNADSICYREILCAAFPNSSYSSETGGLVENLRTSTNNEKVRNYHKKFYRPENILIIIVGQVDSNEVIKSLKPIEQKIYNKSNSLYMNPFVQPWQSDVPDVKSYDPVPIKYPTDSEDSGMIMIGWRGPKILSKDGYLEFTACCTLLRYLSDTPIAPLQQALVEVENPFASDVSMGIIEYIVPLLTLTLENVPLDRMEDALTEFKNQIKSISELKLINMERLKAIIQKQLRETLSHIENTPHDALAFSCIADVLYSLTNEQFEVILNKPNLLLILLSKDRQFWSTLFSKYFDTKFVSIVGSPSKDLMMQMVEDENDRIAQRRIEFGEEGLQKKNNELNSAMAYNEREPPSNIFDTIGSLDYNDLKHFTLELWTSENPDCPYFNVNELPFYSRVHHIKSHFTYITLLMNTCDLDPEEQMYLPLLIELLPQSSYMCDNIKKEHTNLVEEIELLTNQLNFNIGVGKNLGRFSTGEFAQTVSFHVQCEPEKYENVVKLMWCILKNTIFEKSRVHIVAQKMVNDVATIRRQGDRLVIDLLNDMILTNESNAHQCSLLRQQKFLNEIITTLGDRNQYEIVLKNLNKIRQKLLAKNNIWLHFSANLKTHNYTAEPWKKYPIQDAQNDLQLNAIQCGTIVDDSTYLLAKSDFQGRGCVVGIGGVESCFVQQYSPGPLSHSHPDIPALSVALQYFTQLEGPMWRLIRGAGLSYSYSLILKPNEGLIKFQLFKATNGSEAYLKAKQIIESFLQTKNWDKNLFASAKSSLVFDLVDQESSPAKLIKRSLINYFKKVDLKYNIELAKRVMNVQISDLTDVITRWLPGIFDPKISTIAIVCNPSKVEEMCANFEGFGYENLEKYKSLEDSHLAPE